jgi:CubicO group peptidase (beta-lactamase class C family)
LPGTKFASEAVAAITLRELASHTSGLPRIPDNMAFEDPLDPYAGYEREDLLSFVSGFDAEALEESYDYSNLGAGLLGLIAGDAAGSGYAAAMSRDVLRPLGMSHSAVGLADERRGSLARGFSQGADMPNWAGFDALAGAGAIISTTEDLLRFIDANLNEGPMSGVLAAIREPQAAGDTGLGWHLHPVAADDVIYWHNGGTGGYASYLALRPAMRTGFVLLTTSTAYSLVTELGLAQITGASLRAAGGDLDAYPGAYRLAENFVLTVFIEDGRLFGQATGQGRFAMTPADADEFVFPPAGIRVVFERGESGQAERLTLHQGGQVSEAPRVSDAAGVQARTTVEVDPARLEAYVGRYQLAPGAVLSVEARAGQLYAQLTGQPAFPVFPYDDDRFFYKVVDAELHFERTADGQVAAVVLHQAGERRAPKLD